MPFDNYGWPPASKPIAVTGGITTRRKQGVIGETWWSRRFIEVLESFGLENRLARGRSYARKGQVVSLDIAAGAAHAVVQGSRARPYRVVIGVDQLSEDDWRRISSVFAAKAVFLAKLLAGEMPANIEEAFASCSLSLFPEDLDDLETVCSCPDVANPCKHIAAALYLLAESFDEDPFRIFEWRGRSKDELLASLRQTSHAPSNTTDVLDVVDGSVDDFAWSSMSEDESISARLDLFWTYGSDLPEITSNVASPYPDVLLRQLDPFPRSIGASSLADLLEPAFQTIAKSVEESP